MPNDESSVEKDKKLNIEVIYCEQYTHLGRMNDTLYRMPPIFATIIGGLWFFAAQFLEKDRVVSAGVFLFAAASALAFVFALQRYRVVILAYIDNIEMLQGGYSPKVPPTRIRTTAMFMALLTIAFVLSVCGAIYAIGWKP